MLAENMQRNDLTLPEEIYGFQRMIDLGESAEGISDQTGFSRSTVYHRLNIAKLDKDTVADAIENKQISLTDFIELEKISDIETRNKILKDNTDIKYAVKREIEAEQKRAWKKDLIRTIQNDFILEALPENTQTWKDNWHFVKTYKMGEEIETSDLPKENLFWREDWQGINIYYQAEVEEVETEEDKARKKRNEEIKALTSLQEEFKEAAYSYIEYTISENAGRERKAEAVHAWWNYCLDNSLTLDFDICTLAKAAGKMRADVAREYFETEEEYEDKLKEIACDLRYDLQAAVLIYNCIEWHNIFRSWDGNWNKGYAGQWSAFIEILEEYYGFKLNEKFVPLLEGTHKLYKTED
jgi:ParB family chromosome partitioning protein